MTETEVGTRTSDEKLKAGFSYLLGWIPALIFWLQDRKNSEYVRFHSMQAILYSVILVVVGFLTYLIMVVVWTVVIILMIIVTVLIITTSTDSALFPAGIALFIYLLAGVSIIVAFLPIILLQIINIGAMIAGFTGRNWRYPLLAEWADKINQRDLERSRRNES